jgi:glucoamylase
LITTAAAEFLYDAVAQWKASKSITVDRTSEAFFKDIYPAVAVQKYKSSDRSFSQILAAVTTYADSFVAISEKYTPADGSLAEQFDRNTGVPVSAIDLTWSYAAFVTMAQRRAGQYPASWGSRKAAAPPATCSGTSTQGVYAPATAAGAPNVTSSCQILASFNVNASTYYGENIYIVGSTADLGTWDIANGYPLNSGDYTQARPLWDLSVALTAGETISYKYARQEDCNQLYIYEAENRTLVVPPCGGAPVSTNDAWVGPVGTSGNC